MTEPLEEPSGNGESARQGGWQGAEPILQPKSDVQPAVALEDESEPEDSGGTAPVEVNTPVIEAPAAGPSETVATTPPIDNFPPQAPESTTPSAPAQGHGDAEAAPPTVVAAPAAVEEEADAMAAGGVKLVIEQGLSINKEFLISDEDMLIGRRDPEQDFIPDLDLFDQETANNRYISRRQARLFFKGGGLWLEDLDSSNGTALNNHAIKPHDAKRLKFGDKLLLGQSVLLRVRRVAG